MIVQVTYNNDFGGTPHAAAEVNAPTNNINEALEYAFRWTQNNYRFMVKKELAMMLMIMLKFFIITLTVLVFVAQWLAMNS